MITNDHDGKANDTPGEVRLRHMPTGNGLDAEDL